MKIIITLILFVLTSCSTGRSYGPNYNSGNTHNKTLNTRKRVVNKEDIRMKNAMNRARIKASKYKKRHSAKSKKKYRKYI